MDWWRDIALVTKGATVYRRTGVTPDYAYQSLIRLFCRSRGYSNDILAWLLRINRSLVALPNANGVLGDLISTDLARIVSQLKEDGYYIFPQLLPADTCDRLLKFALTAPCAASPPPASPPSRAIYDRHHPVAETYRFTEDVLLGNSDVQQLASDYSILALAQTYLAAPPILDIVTMWWSTTFNATASADAAQLYHFDMDRIKWLKFFFYLTDVTPRTGPHCFVAKSHKRNGQPPHLLKRRYARIPDADIEQNYPADDIKEIAGPRGTMFVADTRAFHKGKPLEEGDRLILQFEFCNSLFGGMYTKTRLKGGCHPHFRGTIGKYKQIYSKFTLDTDQ